MSEAASALPRTLRQNRLAAAAFVTMLLVVLAALAAPYLPLPDPDTVDTPNRLKPPLAAGHVLGTDEFGRDLLARLVWGARVSLLAGVATAPASLLLGVTPRILGGLYTRSLATPAMGPPPTPLAGPSTLP